MKQKNSISQHDIGILPVNLLGNLLSGKIVIRAGEETIRGPQGF